MANNHNNTMHFDLKEIGLGAVELTGRERNLLEDVLTFMFHVSQIRREYNLLYQRYSYLDKYFNDEEVHICTSRILTCANDLLSGLFENCDSSAIREKRN